MIETLALFILLLATNLYVDSISSNVKSIQHGRCL